MADSKGNMGRLYGNIVREDLNEAGRMIGLDFAISVVLNEDKKVVQVLAGNPEDVLKRGAKICADVYGVDIENKFDIVIVSCGSNLKGRKNCHLEKSLNLVAHVTRQGGQVILLTASSQGIGEDIYFDYVCQEIEPDEILVEYRKLELQIGPLNAYLFGRTITNQEYLLESNLYSKILSHFQLRASDISMIIKEWVESYEEKPKLAIIANTSIYIK